jgi:D-3-phosphoglycerate dehydrogenase
MPFATSPIKVSIIGDLFMRGETFAAALKKNDGERFDVTVHENEWPVAPFEPPRDGIKEYQGQDGETIKQIGDAEILILHMAPLTRAVFEQCPNLKLVGIARAGIVNIDRQAAKDHGVQIVNAPGRNASAVAEFTIGAILAQTRLFTVGHASLSQGQWRGDLYRADRTGQELSQMSVGLIGYGAIGPRVARLLVPFGPRIMFDDPYVDITEEDIALGIEKCDFKTLLTLCDVVSMHPRVTDETRGMMNAQAFAMMKPGSYFINTARGPLMDEMALADALRSGHLAGAAIDTFDPEPPKPDHPLFALPNITLTPHIAGASVYVSTFAAELIATDIGKFVRGEPLTNPC